MKTICLISLGCPKNLVDSEVMLGLLEEAGYLIVQKPSEAEVIIVNTCSFIEDAKKESIDTILEMAGLKHRSQRSEVRRRKLRVDCPTSDLGLPTSIRKKCKKLVVTGCLPQRYKDEIARLFPEVDLFVGTGEYQNIVKLLKDRSADSRTHALKHLSAPSYIHASFTPRKIATPRHSVYVKIAEGCFHACSFCIIPKIRGKFRSRPVDDITAEAKRLVSAGARELILIAQDTTSYGVDLKDGTSLAKLVRKISKVRGDFWIRIMYAYPTSITDEFIDTMAGEPKACKYLDIPIQHISDKILKAMKRRETSADIRRLVEKLRAAIPDIALRTSVITGFPGEGKKEFGELLAFIKEGHFNHVGAFAYSKEEGTSASGMKGHVSRQVKEDRKAKLLAAQADVSLGYNEGMIGRTVRVLADGEIVARTQGQAPEIDGITRIRCSCPIHRAKPAPDKSGNYRCELKAGEFADVEITGAGEYDLEAFHA